MRGLNAKIINFINNDTCSDAQELRNIIKDINSSNLDKLFLGIRDNYINIYYKGMSALKIIFNPSNGSIKNVVTHKKYSNGSGKGYQAINVADLKTIVLPQINQYLTMKSNSNHIEKEWQQAAVVENNAQNGQEWFCVDMEYIMERAKNDHANYGRFDIIAISTNSMPKIALIEVKVDVGAFASTGDDIPNLAINKPIDFSTQGCEKLGSGILGHYSNFVRYLNSTTYQSKKGNIIGRFNILKHEVINILENYEAIGLYTNIISNIILNLKNTGIDNIPEVIFYLLGDKNNYNDIKYQLDKYVGNPIRGRAPRDTILNTWNQTVYQIYNQPNSTRTIKYIIEIGKPTGCLFNGTKVATAHKIY